MEHHDFDGGDYQKWQFIHLGDGFYKIQSVKSGLCLAVPSNGVNESDVDIVQEAYSALPRKQWTVVPTTDGAFKIRNRAVTTDLVLCVNSGTSTGTNIQQDDYVDNDSHLDEWYLCRIGGSDAMLMGIRADDHDHTTALGNIMPHISKQGYKDFNYITTDSISKTDVQNAMEYARIYVSRSHGNTDSNGSYILLSDDGTSWLHSNDIYNFTNNTPVVDLSNCDLMLFVACFTGANEDISLPHAAVRAGANSAIGFKEKIDCETANNWTEYFFNYYTQGYSVELSARYAAINCGYLNGSGSHRVVRN